MTDIDTKINLVDHLLELASRATPGPYEVYDKLGKMSGYQVKNLETGRKVCEVIQGAFVNDIDSQNAAYIAACDPIAITELCLRIKRYERALEEIVRYVDSKQIPKPASPLLESFAHACQDIARRALEAVGVDPK